MAKDCDSYSKTDLEAIVSVMMEGSCFCAPPKMLYKRKQGSPVENQVIKTLDSAGDSCFWIKWSKK